MEPERRTTVIPERLPSPPPSWDAARFFANKDRLARLCAAVALVSMAVALGALGIAISMAARPVQYVVLDPAGNAIVAPGAPFEDATQLHVQQALQATVALLNRHPSGFDQPEWLRALFATPALAQADELKAAEAAEFQERQMEQKAHVTRVDAIGTRQGGVQVRVTGQLARWGRIAEVPFVDSLPFMLSMSLRPNPDLLTNRRQPTMVTHFELSYEHERP
jgi:hypothetical protein